MFDAAIKLAHVEQCLLFLREKGTAAAYHCVLKEESLL